jgi:hypothetical protein
MNQQREKARFYYQRKVDEILGDIDGLVPIPSDDWDSIWIWYLEDGLDSLLKIRKVLDEYIAETRQTLKIYKENNPA